MPGPWDRDNNRDQGQIGELPLGGLLSELLASEGVDPTDFGELLPESMLDVAPDDSSAAPVETAAAEMLSEEPLRECGPEPAIALPGLAAQLWALNRATETNEDVWPEPEAPVLLEPEAAAQEPETPPEPEPNLFALPGLLFSLTEEIAEAPQESEPTPEPIVEAVSELQPEPEPDPAPAAPVLEEPAIAATAPLIEIVEAHAGDLPDIEVPPLHHSRANDLSNLIGAIDSELAAAPSLLPGLAHELDKTHERFVCFRLGGISYGLHMRLVREVERVGRVTQVPGAPRLVCGLINLRGEILPLIDTRLLLAQEPAGWPPSGYLLVLQTDPEEPPLALLVDELGGVAIVDPAAVETDMTELEHSMATHTLGLAEHRGRVVLLLDHRNLVTPEALMASAETGSSN